MKIRIEVNNVSVMLGGIEVLRNVNLVLSNGLHVLLGRNGSGKTTLLRVIDGLIKPIRGSVKVNGIDVFKAERKELAKIIGYVWQNPFYGFFEENVKREIEFIIKNLKVKGRSDVVDILGLEELLNRSPFVLSGGEARLVSIASVVIADQPIILIDEPFMSLDIDGVERVMSLLKKFRREGKLVLITTHNVLLTYMLNPDTLTLIDRGVIVYHGPLSKISDEMLESAGVISRRWLCGVCLEM